MLSGAFPPQDETHRIFQNLLTREFAQLCREDLAFSQRLTSVHDINFFTAWELGERVGIKLPENLVIFAIEVEDVLTFGETLTPQVEAVVPEVCRLVLTELNK